MFKNSFSFKMIYAIVACIFVDMIFVRFQPVFHYIPDIAITSDRGANYILVRVLFELRIYYSENASAIVSNKPLKNRFCCKKIGLNDLKRHKTSKNVVCYLLTDLRDLFIYLDIRNP